MTQPRDAASSIDSSVHQDVGTGVRAEGRESGARRRKLAGYLKAANDLRQSYQHSYTSGWGTGDGSADSVDDGTPGAFPDAVVIRGGNEEMILFPGYARKHIKRKPQAEPGTIQEVPGVGRDVRDTAGAGDAEFWRQEWEKYEDDNAVVDVDVRGWLYSPHRGQMNRKHRLLIGLARQLSGIPAPKASPTASRAPSRNTSPHGSPRERMEARAARREEEIVAQEAEAILKKGEAEARAARRGAFSEAPRIETDNDSLHSLPSRPNSPSRRQSEAGSLDLGRTTSNSSYKDDDPSVTPVQRRATWSTPANMSPAELATANSHLMARLMPFLANPLANTPISAFFYNDERSRQRTFNTDSAGHFSLRAALDFVPTHVRILASEKLSATEKVIITEPRGVSLISDIDDTIKHTAITSGAREIFRNAFIRELADLTIEGVKEWYSRLADMGVKFHYVSNSPWQLYPVLKGFVSMAGLPPGSFHLKQYSGMLQGIFEPVAERKKSTMDRIARDFPERKFILVGDSGEADLEVYTDFVIENPERVLGVFIRDVTTPIPRGFFDSSMGSLRGERSSRSGQQFNGTNGSTKFSSVEENHDPELQAAIAASLRDIEEQNRKMGSSVAMNRTTTPNTSKVHGATDRPNPMPRRPTEPPAPEAHQLEPPLGDLIEFSDDEYRAKATRPPIDRSFTETSALAGAKFPSPSTKVTDKSLAPMPPRKPLGLRSPSSENPPATYAQVSPPAKRAPPPKPRRPSSSVQTPGTTSPHPSTQPPQQKPTATKPPISRNPYSYASTARQKLSSGLAHWHGTATANHAPDQARAASTATPTSPTAPKPDEANTIAKRPHPPPPRRAISSYPAAAAHYASDRATGFWGSSASASASGAGSGSGARNGTQQPYSTASHSSSKVSLGGGAGGTGSQPVNKREEMWRRRWERAERIMAERGVVLKTWRVGTDVLDVTVRLVEQAKEKEREEGMKERRGAVGGEE